MVTATGAGFLLMCMGMPFSPNLPLWLSASFILINAAFLFLPHGEFIDTLHNIQLLCFSVIFALMTPAVAVEAGFGLIAVGIFCNQAALTSNGMRMPVANLTLEENLWSSALTHKPMDSLTKLRLLCDWIPMPLGGKCSIGDFCLLFGFWTAAIGLLPDAFTYLTYLARRTA